MDRPGKSTPRAVGVTPKPAPDIEVGVSAYLPFVVPYRNAWEALRDDEVTVKQLIAMRKTDGQARALYRLITLPIRAALKAATFIPEDNVEGGEDEAAFIQQMFTLPANAGGMTVPFNRFVAQLLMAVFDGFSAFELVYWVPKKGPLKDKWTLKKAAHRPSETLTFVLNERSEFHGLRQQTMYQGRHVDVFVPAEHAIYWAANEEERPFYGQSYFHTAFFHWDKKFRLYVIAHLAAQRAAVGTRVGKVPANPNREELAAFRKSLSDLGVAQWMTMPADYEVDSVKETIGFDFLSFINHHNSQMSKSVLAAFFDKEQGGGGDAKLVDFGAQSDSLFLLMLQTIMGEIEEVINQHVIPRFIDWNFDSGKYPKFQFGSLSAEQKAAMFELFKQLAVAGQSLTIRPEVVHEMEKQVSEELGLEIDWDTVEEEMAFDKEQQALAEELMAQEQAMGMPAAGAGAPGAGGPPAPAPSPIVDPSLLPKGFTLSDTDPATLALTDLARDLLDEAYDAVTLTRGVPNSGGPKFVRTAAGAAVYGVPIGTAITRDMEERTAAQGVKGKVFGGGVRGPQKAPGTKREVLGGGLGAPAQNPGGVTTDPGGGSLTPKAIYINERQPGAQLLDYGDGTVAIRDANGNTSARHRFDVAAFVRLGWKLVGEPVKSGAKKAAAKTTTRSPAKRTPKKAAPGT